MKAKLFFVLILVLAAVPYAIGLFMEEVVVARLAAAEAEANKEKPTISFTVVNVDHGYLSSAFRIKSDFLGVKNTSSVVLLNINHLPDLSSLAKGDLKVNFSGPIENVSMASPKLPGGLVDANKMSVEGGVINGNYTYPNGVEVRSTIPMIQNPDKSMVIENTYFEFSLKGQHSSAAFGFDKFGINIKIFALEVNKFVVRSKQLDPEHHSFEWGMNINSPMAQMANGLDLSLTGNFAHLPKTKEEFSLRGAFEKKSEFDLKLEAKAEGASIISEGKAKIEQVAIPGPDGQEFLPNFVGKVTINFDPTVKNVVTQKTQEELAKHAPEFMSNYNIDLLKPPVIISLSYTSLGLAINGIPYFNCPYPMKGNVAFNSDSVKAMDLEVIKADAIEDLMIEEPQMMGEPFCRLKYKREVQKLQDPVAKILIEMIEIKLGSSMAFLTDPAAKTKELAEQSKTLKGDVELYILSNFIPCIVDAKSESCGKTSGLGGEAGMDEHPFRKLTRLSMAMSPSLADIQAIKTPEGIPSYASRLYAIFQSKLLLQSYYEKKDIKKIAEFINTERAKFSRNFVPYEAVKYVCTYFDLAKCQSQVQQLGAYSLPKQLREMYMMKEIDALKRKLATIPKDTCPTLVDELITRMTGASDPNDQSAKMNVMRLRMENPALSTICQ